MTDCAICAEHRGEGPLVGRQQVWRDDLLVVWQAAGPALGHLLVETRRHAPFLSDLTDDEIAALCTRLRAHLRPTSQTQGHATGRRRSAR